MDSKCMFDNISKDIRNKLAKYFVRGFDRKDLIILIPTRFFDVLASHVERKIDFSCENPTDSTEIKVYIVGVETKRVDDLDDIYVSLK